MSTAALETICAGRDRASGVGRAAPAGGRGPGRIRQQRGPGGVPMTARKPSLSCPNAAVPAVTPGDGVPVASGPSAASSRDRADDRVVPGQDGARGHLAQPEHPGHDGHGERCGQAPAQVAPPGRAHHADQPVRFTGHERFQLLVHGGLAERAGERAPVPVVLGAVQREHARSDDPGRREARVVHGEGRAVPHDRQGQVAPGHQPAAQDRHPGDRLSRAQPGQAGVRVIVEVRQPDGRAQRILASPRGPRR